MALCKQGLPQDTPRRRACVPIPPCRRGAAGAHPAPMAQVARTLHTVPPPAHAPQPWRPLAYQATQFNLRGTHPSTHRVLVLAPVLEGNQTRDCAVSGSSPTPVPNTGLTALPCLPPALPSPVRAQLPLRLPSPLPERGPWLGMASAQGTAPAARESVAVWRGGVGMQALGSRSSVEYLRLEEWQRWEGNQLLHTERLRLYQVHLEINETLTIAPTTSTKPELCCRTGPMPATGQPEQDLLLRAGHLGVQGAGPSPWEQGRGA